jgi:DNA polymerase (family X)
VIEEPSFVVETEDFAKLTSQMERYEGQTTLVESNKELAVLALSSGPLLRTDLADAKNWGLSLIRRTGNKAHLKKLVAISGSLTHLESNGSFATEQTFYDNFGIAYIEPELREGLEEVRQARQGTLPILVTEKDIRGDLHMHTEASDGSNSIEQMAAAAQDAGYVYIGISDHSQSLKIAGGVSEENFGHRFERLTS